MHAGHMLSFLHVGHFFWREWVLKKGPGQHCYASLGVIAGKGSKFMPTAGRGHAGNW